MLSSWVMRFLGDLLAGRLLDHLDRHDLVLELAHAGGHERLLVALHGVLVLLLAADAVLLGQVLGGAAHDQVAGGIGQALPTARR